MKTFLVLECLQQLGIVDNGPTIKKVVEFRFCFVGAQNKEQAIRWIEINQGWSPSIILRYDGFRAFSYEGAQSVVSHACGMQQNVRIRDGHLEVNNLDPFSEVIRQIPMYVFEGIAGRLELRKIARVEELAETG